MFYYLYKNVIGDEIILQNNNDNIREEMVPLNESDIQSDDDYEMTDVSLHVSTISLICIIIQLSQ